MTVLPRVAVRYQVKSVEVLYVVKVQSTMKGLLYVGPVAQFNWLVFEEIKLQSPST